MEGIAGANTLKEAYQYLTGETMIGEYYGYHCSTSNSVNPNLNFTHDDTFVAPGPGARETLDLMFPNLTTRQVSYGDRVVWIRENQHQILNINFHKSLWNYTTSNGITIFNDKQNELKSYGTEVSLCQYSVYCRLRSNPELISRRKIARSATKCEIIVENKTKEKREMGSNFFNTIVEAFSKKKFPAKVPGMEPESKSKPDLDFSVTSKEEIVLSAISSMGISFTHKDILTSIKSKNLDHLFKLDSNWKETWAIMQGLVKKNVLLKEGKNYTKAGE